MSYVNTLRPTAPAVSGCNCGPGVGDAIADAAAIGGTTLMLFGLTAAIFVYVHFQEKKTGKKNLNW